MDQRTKKTPKSILRVYPSLLQTPGRYYHNRKQKDENIFSMQEFPGHSRDHLRGVVRTVVFPVQSMA
jgi:hypothetical protein